ncbi:hypothetical protein TRFO_41405 [Tritrichomonas foetus]|uniref:Regulator of chromosome condensation n=1 Tax=Tritrichomonas foetus TaxID=1144522 RepID=A0A1J4L0I4_9EUKA|nr:hypothetical protein TRFO_41405 [Tritrichomonas foetus]|eukprot:OHT16979.1 hypothetical protein TRFO_41405 [Tritrichomonas foetus]
MSKLKQMKEMQIISAGTGALGRDENHRQPFVRIPTKNLSCISTGCFHSVALFKRGDVYGWGFNSNGILGFPEEIENVKYPQEILIMYGDDLCQPIPKIIDVKSGRDFILFLTKEKKVLISSSNESTDFLFEEIKICEPAVALFGFWDPWIVGESGTVYWYDFKKTNRIEKFGPFPFGIPKQIVSIKHSVLLLTTKGETYGMSMKELRPRNFKRDYYVVCDNEDNFSLIESLRDVKIIKISGSIKHFLALSEENKVFAWGENDFGQLGVGDKNDRDDGFVLSTDSGEAKIVDIAAGYFHSILVDSTGHAWGFGSAHNGQTMLGKMMIGEEKNSLIPNIESAVSAYCGGYFSYILIGDSPLPEAGTLSLICKKGKKHHSKHSLKIDKCLLS